MKRSPKKHCVLHSMFRGIEIFWYNAAKQYAATFNGCQMMSPDVNVIRRAIMRRKGLVSA